MSVPDLSDSSLTVAYFELELGYFCSAPQCVSSEACPLIFVAVRTENEVFLCSNTDFQNKETKRLFPTLHKRLEEKEATQYHNLSCTLLNSWSEHQSQLSQDPCQNPI